MPLELAAVEAKILRAEEHFKILHMDILEKIEACTYSVDHVRNDNFTDLSLRLKANGFRFPLLWWTLVIGDFINNLRSSLDHLIHSIAVYESGKETPPKENKLAFPIEDNWDKFKDRGIHALGDLSAKAWTAIESVQPYHRPSLGIPPPLRILRELSNADKHRTIDLADATPTVWNFTFTEPVNPAIRRVYRSSHGNLEDGAEIAGVESSEPELELTTLGNLGIGISIRHGALDGRIDPGADRSEIILLCQILMAEVKGVVLEVKSIYD